MNYWTNLIAKHMCLRYEGAQLLVERVQMVCLKPPPIEYILNTLRALGNNPAAEIDIALKASRLHGQGSGNIVAKRLPPIKVLWVNYPTGVGENWIQRIAEKGEISLESAEILVNVVQNLTVSPVPPFAIERACSLYRDVSHSIFDIIRSANLITNTIQRQVHTPKTVIDRSLLSTELLRDLEIEPQKPRRDIHMERDRLSDLSPRQNKKRWDSPLGDWESD